MEGERLLAELRTVLSYNPRTGRFTWLVERSIKIKPGSRAGTSAPESYCEIGYTDTEGVRHRFRGHQLAALLMTGMPSIADHVDRDKANNAWVNLRPTTTSLNGFNAKLSRRNSSGKTGVCWDASRGKYMATFGTINLGRFDRYDDAVAARRAAELEYLGEYCPS
jgi:hypothetical protein